MKILCLNRYGRLGASSRLRFYQYLPYLQAEGIDVTISPLLSDDYIQNLYSSRGKDLNSIFSAYIRRLWALLKTNRFNLLWIQYEILPWLPAWAETIIGRLGIPYVVDYDDAVFHRYDMHPNSMIRTFLSRKVGSVMCHASLVIVGNDYLADYAKRMGAKRIEYLPTVIDLNRYHIVTKRRNDIFTIGWIGSPVTCHYLHLIQFILEEFCADGRSRLVLVGSGKIRLDGVPLEIRDWSEETESKNIQDFDVGIMPLIDDPWERGKCGYKLIQYMGSGKPVVASPVGVNQKIVENGLNGFLVNTLSDWLLSLRTLRDNQNLREIMGRSGRQKVEAMYCLQVTAPSLVSLLKGAAKESN